jgi:glycosyltransferase involved in cell wall biosynthesis
MKKILIWGVNPNSNKGLGKLTRLVYNSLYKIPFFVINYSPDCQYIGGDYQYKNYHNDINSLLEVIKKNQIDLILSIGDLWSCEPLYEVTKFLPIPWVAYLGSEGYTYPKKAFVFEQKSGQIQFMNLDLMVENISAFWGFSKHTEIVLKKEFPEKPSYTLPLAADVQAIKKAPALPLRSKLGIPDEKRLIGFIGNNVRRKGLDLFVKMLSQNTKFVGYAHTNEIAGETGYNIRELRDVYKLQDRLFYPYDLKMAMDSFTDEMIYGMYKEFDLFYHPHRAEGFGLCILEALISGVPVLATDCSGPSTFLPKNCKIPTSNIHWDQLGGVGYIVKEPDIFRNKINFRPNDFDPIGYRLEDFQKNLLELIKLDYNPILTRKI